MFQRNFAGLFVLNYWLREFPLSTKATDASVLQNLTLFKRGVLSDGDSESTVIQLYRNDGINTKN